MLPETPEDYYIPIYFEALDLITTSITDRFNRPGYVFHNVHNLILKAVQGLDYEAELKCVANFYPTDFNYYKITDVTEFFNAMTPVQRELLSEVCQLFQLQLVILVTNVVSERSFSAL